IIDHDRVDESNLQRQVLYTTADIGKPKVQIARKRLRELNPGVSVDIWQEKLTKDNAEQILKNYDVAVTATDNFASRFIMNDICVKLGIPLVYGAICRFEGQVSVFNYKGGPTYRCLYAEPEDTVREQDDPELGVIGVLPGIIGCMQANEAIKIITGYGSTLSGKLYVLSISDMEGHTLKIDSTS
ncbi:MAG: HesA/MoeB/ThiF family protein, partial [Bacteroidetes bacterium]|nr:HesA/MoeB/ThiF family protein [Bacteroidota bacterium]